MSDIGSEYADERIRVIERKLNKIYSEASKDLEEKIRLFTKKYETKEKIHLEELEDEKITQDDFDAWKRGQVFQSEQWEAKRKQVLHTLTQTNEMASQIVNDEAVKVFTMNGNFAAYDLENTGGVNFGFPLYDATSVVNIVKQEDPYLLPQWKINEPKDYIWNSKKVGNQIAQGIIQGEKLDQIAKRLAKNLCMQNKNSSLTFARTAMTGAQNGGRSLRYRQAEKLGINMHQEWMATLDGRTRHSHRSMDGEKIPVGKDFKFSNECRYPGDPEGPAWEVYNCRCTLVADLDDYPAFYSRRDNVSGEVVNKIGPDTVSNLTYKDWVTTKKVMQKAKHAEEIEEISSNLLNASKLGSGSVNYDVGNGKTSFDYKYKGFDSLFRKIVTKSAAKNMTKEQYAEKITDALRFTSLSPSDTLTDDYFKMVDYLESKNYKMVEVTNTFSNYDSYRGINTLVKSPNNYVFELQFHTTQSMEIKEINHKLYEEQRKLDKTKDADRIRELIKIQKQNADKIQMPNNVDLIKNIEY